MKNGTAKEKNGGSKLKEDDVRHIKQSSFSTKTLAKHYDVAYATIWDIRNGRSWTHLS